MGKQAGLASLKKNNQQPDSEVRKLALLPTPAGLAQSLTLKGGAISRRTDGPGSHLFFLISRIPKKWSLHHPDEGQHSDLTESLILFLIF